MITKCWFCYQRSPVDRTWRPVILRENPKLIKVDSNGKESLPRYSQAYEKEWTSSLFDSGYAAYMMDRWMEMHPKPEN